MALGMMAGANAALIDRGNGMIYDDVLNITWLQDWNYAYTSGYAATNEGGTLTITYDSWQSTIVSADGRMGWDAATTWAANLSFSGYNNWRLPTGDPTQPAGSLNELGSIYLATTGYQFSGSRYGLNEPFLNTAGIHWSSNEITIARLLEFAPYNDSYYSRWPTRADAGVGAFVLDTGTGRQGPFDKIDIARAVAVRDGDVAPAPVPVPATLALLGLGLAGIGAVRRKQA